MILADKDKYHAADVNGDGVLDKSEYPAFMHPYDFPHMHDSEIRRIVQQYDKNNDNTIDISEYIKTDDFRKFSCNIRNHFFSFKLFDNS